MTRIFTLVYFAIGISCVLSAQIEQVSVGESYSQQAYYSLATGESVAVENNAWDIAFSAIGQQDAGVFINESGSLTEVALQLYTVSDTDWTDKITDTDQFVDSVAIFNPELNWTEGAFNTVKDPNSPFDYGWGSYNPQTHMIEGDKLFVIKKRDGSFIKFQVVSLAGGSYNFRFADLDGSNEVNYSVSKDDAESNLIYYSFETTETVAMPTDYDLIFQRYTTSLDAGEGEFIEYTVTGVLLANGVEAVVADGVDPNNVSETDYADQYSSLPTTIGHTWKAFDFNEGWIMDEDRTQFIKSRNGDIYQITFYDFEGSSTGTTTFEKTIVTTVSSEDLTLDYTVAVAPNPTTDYFTLISESNEIVDIQIINASGNIVNVLQANTNVPIPVNDLVTGVYFISIYSGDLHTTKKLIVR